MTTRHWHRGHCTLTGLRDRTRDASRVPIYVHSWRHRWQVTRQLVNRFSMEELVPVPGYEPEEGGG